MRQPRSSIRLLFLADTHLGFDQPVRPRVERRRRGPDFFANFRSVLATAVDERVDLVVHGGDLFFRSKIPEAIVDEVYRDLLEFAESGIPVVIVPGNHERSRLPTSLFLQHPGIHIFDGPATFVLEFGGARVALGGFPNVRRDIRSSFPAVVAETGLLAADADLRLLCIHQTVEGARVGPVGYTFRSGHDIVRQRDLPASCDAVLAGHIHRHQVLEVERDAATPLPVIYPGSIERTSFAEADETKGYCDLEFAPRPDGSWALVGNRFVPLPARPMISVDVPPDLEPGDVRRFLQAVARRAPADAIVRFTSQETVTPAMQAVFSSRRLHEVIPSSLNVQFGSGFFPSRGRRTSS